MLQLVLAGELGHPLLRGPLSCLTHCLSVQGGRAATGTLPSEAWCIGARSVPSPYSCNNGYLTVQCHQPF